jgi:hypothetical protein
MRKKIVVVAVVQDEQGRFLLTRHPRWNGLSLPMNSVDSRNDVSSFEAIRAVEEDLGCSLPDASAHELEFLVHAGHSPTADVVTSYDFHLYEVYDPWISTQRSLDNLDSKPQFLSLNEILVREDVAWGTKALIEEFTSCSKVVVPIIARPGPQGTEVLLVQNAFWNFEFLPSRRCRSDAPHDQVVKTILRDDLGFLGDIQLGTTIEDFHMEVSSKYQIAHTHHLNFYQVTLVGDSDEELDPTLANVSQTDALNRKLKGLGKKYRWVRMDHLNANHANESPLAEQVVQSIRRLAPSLQVSEPEVSIVASVALVHRADGSERCFLARFDENKRLTYLGGPVAPGETSEACLKRHLFEQLGVDSATLETDDSAQVTCHSYIRVHGEPGRLTRLQLTAFPVTLSATAIHQTYQARSGFRWLSAKEVRNGVTDNGPAIDPILQELLFDENLIPPAPNINPIRYLD